MLEQLRAKKIDEPIGFERDLLHAHYQLMLEVEYHTEETEPGEIEHDRKILAKMEELMDLL